jgi:hypothetical protein
MGAVFAATDNLLLSLGVAGSEAVNGDIQWQFDAFLKSWQQGGWAAAARRPPLVDG